MPNSTSLFVETMALKEGCKICVKRQYLPVILEIDSLALIKMKRGECVIALEIL